MNTFSFRRSWRKAADTPSAIAREVFRDGVSVLNFELDNTTRSRRQAGGNPGSPQSSKIS